MTSTVSNGLRGSLVTCASHPIVPVHVSALRICPPGPDVQLKERRDVEAVWAINELKDLTLKYGRIVVMTLQPRVRKDYELDAHQPHASVRWFVDQGLRL